MEMTPDTPNDTETDFKDLNLYGTGFVCSSFLHRVLD